MHFLQLDVENEFVYGDAASVSQLETLNRKFPRTGIFVAQMEIVAVHNTSLGEIEDTLIFELDWTPTIGESIEVEALKAKLRQAARSINSIAEWKSRSEDFTGTFQLNLRNYTKKTNGLN